MNSGKQQHECTKLDCYFCDIMNRSRHVEHHLTEYQKQLAIRDQKNYDKRLVFNEFLKLKIKL
jgi:hypothetical protein